MWIWEPKTHKNTLNRPYLSSRFRKSGHHAKAYSSNIFWCRLWELVRKSISPKAIFPHFLIFFFRACSAQNRRAPGIGETTFARLRRKKLKKRKDRFRGNGLSDRFTKTASKNIEKRRRSRLLRDVHFHEISIWDPGSLVYFRGFSAPKSTFL